MDAPERGALTLVRLIGAVLIVASLLELGLYWAECHMPRHHVDFTWFPAGLRLIPALAGVAVLIKARAIADWISNILE
jgi:hypothetical protein